MLEDRGISFDELALSVEQPDADPFDLLCHLAFNAPLRTRRERAERVRREKQDFFDRYGSEARRILDELLDKYAEHGTAQFVIPDVLEVPPISERGNVIEIAKFFGGAGELRSAVLSGYLLRDVVNKINGIHFNSSDEMHTLSRLYESLLKEMRDAAGIRVSSTRRAPWCGLWSK